MNALSSAADVVMEEEEGDAEAQSVDQDIAAPADGSAAVSSASSALLSSLSSCKQALTRFSQAL